MVESLEQKERREITTKAKVVLGAAKNEYLDVDAELSKIKEVRREIRAQIYCYSVIERDEIACAERYATQVKETMPVLMRKVKETREQKSKEEAEMESIRKLGRVPEQRPVWNETNT